MVPPCPATRIPCFTPHFAARNLPSAHTEPSLHDSPPDATPQLSFRGKLATLAAVAVILTVLSLLIPVSLHYRASAVDVHAEQLLVVARSAAVALHPDSIDAAARGARGDSSILQARRQLLRLWNATGAHAGDEIAELAVVQPVAGGYRKVIAAGGSSALGEGALWTPSPAIQRAVSSPDGAATGVYRTPAGQFVSAVAPVRRADRSAAGYVVASFEAEPILDEATSAVLGFSVYALIALIVAIALASWGAKGLTSGIHAAVAHADHLARGDLTSTLRWTGSDEVGRLADSLREMTERLRTVVGETEQYAAEIAASAEQLAAGAEEMTATTEEVAGAAQAIAETAGVQQRGINVMVDASTRLANRATHVAGFAQNAHDAAEVVARSALRGEAAATEALESMAAISAVTQDAVPAVVELGAELQPDDERRLEPPDAGVDAADRVPRALGRPPNPSRAGVAPDCPWR